MGAPASALFGEGGPGNCETPAGERGRRDPAESEASEEARQLARGKRVIYRSTLRSIKIGGSNSPFVANRHCLQSKSTYKKSIGLYNSPML